MNLKQLVTHMNVSLNDIQADIQRLAQQQTQNQAQHAQVQQLMQAQHIANLLNQVRHSLVMSTIILLACFACL